MFGGRISFVLREMPDKRDDGDFQNSYRRGIIGLVLVLVRAANVCGT